MALTASPSDRIAVQTIARMMCGYRWRICACDIDMGNSFSSSAEDGRQIAYPVASIGTNDARTSSAVSLYGAHSVGSDTGGSTACDHAGYAGGRIHTSSCHVP